MRALRILGSTLQAAGLLAGFGWWLWAMALWYTLMGSAGLGVGMLTISDFALPFVWYEETGHWPLAWIITMFAFIAVIGAGGSLREWADERLDTEAVA